MPSQKVRYSTVEAVDSTCDARMRVTADNMQEEGRPQGCTAAAEAPLHSGDDMRGEYNCFIHLNRVTQST